MLPLPAQRFPRLQTLWADSAYREEFVERVQAYGLAVEINNPASRTGFQPVPWRWVVERTFTWLGNYRRLSEDYEYGVATSDAMIYVAMVHLMVRRLARLQADP